MSLAKERSMAETPQAPAGRPATPRWVKGLGVALVTTALVVVIVMIVSGGQHGPGMHTGGGPSEAPNGAPSDGVGGPASSAEAPRTIAVTTRDSMDFEPASIHVSAGEVVTFVVTNAGQATHEFTLGDAAMQRDHADAMAHMPPGVHHALPNSLSLAPGETKQLTWRFGAAGTFEYACHEPGHYDAGMRGPITVS
jgi:uncharacterized cupredoxin-like copper-binding protein